jgi:hypothetical protein
MQFREHIRSISYLKSHAAQISEDVAAMVRYTSSRKTAKPPW